jgi:hypothetical protein
MLLAMVEYILVCVPVAFLYIRPHRYERLRRSALDLVVLSPDFFEGTTKSYAIKTKPWRVAMPVLTAKLWEVSHREPVKKP